MLIQLILFLLLGIFSGTITGLIPGIHINLIGAFLISLSTTVLFSLNPIYFVIFITSMAITHTFIDFIPSILLGCPDTDTELSILPGHKLLKKGLGYQAILLTVYGSVAAIVILILILPIFFLIIPKINSLIQNLLPFILITVSIFLIYLEKRKFSALLVFFLTGILGLTVLNLPNINQPLLPLLTGLFGASSLILTIKNKPKIPKQIIAKPKIKILKPLLGAIIASPLCSFLPGLGSGQAAIIGNTISKTDNRGFLVLLGATNTLVMGFSFVSLYLISKTRTGAAVAIKEITGVPSQKILAIIIITIILSSIISYFLSIQLAKIFSTKIHSFNYSFISSITLATLIIIVLAVSGLFGTLILATSTLTGLYCISLKVKRTNMMGCLLIPTIILYLF